MEVLELISEILPYVLSIFATVMAFRKPKKELTAEEIEAKAEAKKQKLVAKLTKKNHLKSECKSETIKVGETNLEDNQSGYTTL